MSAATDPLRAASLAAPVRAHGQTTAAPRAPRRRLASLASRSRRPGFTLLEVVVALAILGMSMMAIFNINSQAVYAHVYAKKLTVATLLARSKMTDIEQELYDKGFQVDDDDQGGDFSEEGWPSFKWRAKIIAPKANGLSPDQLISAIFGLPTGGKNDPSGIGALASMFGGNKPPPGAPPPPATDPSNLLASAMGPAAGLMSTQFTQLVDQLTKAVREVHLTVTWKEGKMTESFDIVTHVVSLGPGSDRNGGLAAETLAKSGQNAATGNPSSEQWVRMSDCGPVANPVPAPNGSGMIDPASGTPLVTAAQCMAMKGGAPPGATPPPIPSVIGQQPPGLNGLPGNLRSPPGGLFNRGGRIFQ
jgi:general secretion pathway protein I